VTDRPFSLDPVTRIPLVDAARGIALVAMAVYHFAFDLSDFGLIDVDIVRDPGWRLFARTVAASFLALVGVSLVLAARAGLNRRRYAWRLVRIAAGAAAITLVTWWTVPQAFVYFGILHAIALFSVLALPFLALPLSVVLVAATLCLLAPYFLTMPLFSPPWLLWLGLAPAAPISVDYVPLFPWFAATLAGLAGTRMAIAVGWDRVAAGWTPSGPFGRTLALAGRWSLPIYLVHQPVLIGLIGLFLKL
jgi:uncharacterized membrane protein